MNWQQKIYESVLDLDKPKKSKPIVKKADPFAHLSPKLRIMAIASSALKSKSTRKQLGRLGSK